MKCKLLKKIWDISLKNGLSSGATLLDKKSELSGLKYLNVGAHTKVPIN